MSYHQKAYTNMANVYDYIKWRGDLGFDERPFCEIDSLVLCQLSYIDMQTVFPESGMLSVREAVEALLESGGGQLDTMILNGEEEQATYTAFAKAAADSRRFGPLLMEQYVDVRDKEKQTQFSAVTFRLDPHTSYVAFRGTDDSLVGWKEDFMLSFERIPAQDAALAYLIRRMEEGTQPGPNNVPPDGTAFHQIISRSKRFHVGGHSKGANLALYAAALLPEELQQRLIHVHLYDGPGLCPDVALTPVEYAGSRTSASGQGGSGQTAPNVLDLIAAIDPIATKIVPEYDVVGKIFEMPITDNRIVKSSGEGVMQHAITTWQLTPGGELDLVPQNAPGSIWIGKALDAWIGGVDNDSRRIFIDDLFNVLAAGGESVNDFSSLTPLQLERILSEVSGISSTTIDVAVSLPIAAATGVGRRERSRVQEYLLGLFRHNTYSRALLLIAAGACCLMLPGSLLPLSLGVVLTILLFYEIFYYVKRLRELKWDVGANSTQGFLCLASIMVYAIILIKNDMLTILSNIVYGGVFLFLAYHIFKRLDDNAEHSTLPKAWSIAEGVALILLAVLVLIVPTGALAAFTIALGSILIIDGIAQLIHVYRVRRRRASADTPDPSHAGNPSGPRDGKEH